MSKDYFFNFDKMHYIRSLPNLECILCAVKERNSSVVDLSFAESEHFVISLNLYPFNPGHILIFPKKHIESISELDSSMVLDQHNCLNTMIQTIETTHGSKDFNIGWNMGAVAGASINHLHLHLIPRYPREIGMADLLGGKRVLVEHPQTTIEKFQKYLANSGYLSLRQIQL